MINPRKSTPLGNEWGRAISVGSGTGALGTWALLWVWTSMIYLSGPASGSSNPMLPAPSYSLLM